MSTDLMWFQSNGQTFHGDDGIYLEARVRSGCLKAPAEMEIYCPDTDVAYKTNIKKIIRSGVAVDSADSSDGDISLLTDMFMVFFTEGTDLILCRPEDRKSALKAFKRGKIIPVQESPVNRESAETIQQPAADYNHYETDHEEIKETGDSLLKDKRVLVVLAVIGILALLLVGVLIGKSFGEKPDDSSFEDPSVTEPDDTPIAEDNELGIPEGAVEYNGSYYLIVDEPAYWTDARTACEDMGGHLVTVMDAGEQEFLISLIQERGTMYHYWLGATDEAEEGYWEWVTGERLPTENNSGSGYANWCDNQPNDKNFVDEVNGQDYLEMQMTRGDREREDYSEYATWTDICNSGDGGVNPNTGVDHREAPDYNSTKYYGYICEWNDVE